MTINTKDGTPISDFIHILDLVDIHVIVAKSLIKTGEIKFIIVVMERDFQ